MNISTGFYLKNYTKIRKDLGYNFDEFDIIWTKNKIIGMSLISLITGFLAGILGVGGGIVMGPVML